MQSQDLSSTHPGTFSFPDTQPEPSPCYPCLDSCSFICLQPPSSHSCVAHASLPFRIQSTSCPQSPRLPSPAPALALNSAIPCVTIICVWSVLPQGLVEQGQTSCLFYSLPYPQGSGKDPICGVGLQGMCVKLVHLTVWIMSVDPANHILLIT